MPVTMTLAVLRPEMSDLTIPRVLEIADQQTKTYKSVAAAKAAARNTEIIRPFGARYPLWLGGRRRIALIKFQGVPLFFTLGYDWFEYDETLMTKKISQIIKMERSLFNGTHY